MGKTDRPRASRRGSRCSSIAQMLARERVHGRLGATATQTGAAGGTVAPARGRASRREEARRLSESMSGGLSRAVLPLWLQQQQVGSRERDPSHSPAS